METRQRWFDRKFELGLGPEAAADVLERLRSAPARLEQAVTGLSAEALTRRANEKWSIQENAGHLGDLEELWEHRFQDYQRGSTELHPADLENRRTHEAGHNERPIAEIVAAFRMARKRIVDKLARFDATELSRTALHPRLRQPMSVVDLMFFVAEHDDHHLRTIEELRSAVR